MEIFVCVYVCVCIRVLLYLWRLYSLCFLCATISFSIYPFFCVNYSLLCLQMIIFIIKVKLVFHFIENYYLYRKIFSVVTQLTSILFDERMLIFQNLLYECSNMRKNRDIELPSNCLFTTSFHKVFGLAVNLIEA